MRNEIKNIKINGYSLFNYKLFDYLKPTFLLHFNTCRSNYILGKRQLRSGRFNDDVTVWHRIISGLWNAKLEPSPSSLTIEEVQYLINKALKDCASAEFFYTYEKEWD